MEKEKENQWQNFKQMVADMTDNKFYEEVVSCRMISFGSCEGDDKEYFFDLINAYAENKYKAKAEVDEEKLDKLAEENCPYCDFAYDCGECRACEDDTARDGYINGFKDGYRKAKEEK